MDDIATLIIKKWEIECKDGSKEARKLRESIFSQGSGYMGIRGYRPDEPGENKAWRSTFFAGFFEYIRPGITDMVNQPDYSATNLVIDGTDSNDLNMKNFSQILDMKYGKVIWKYTLETPEKKEVLIKIERFLSMSSRQTAAMRYTVTPIDCDCTISFLTGIDADVQNLPIADNQLTENIELLRLWRGADMSVAENGGSIRVSTAHSKRETAMSFKVSADKYDSKKEVLLKEKNYVGINLTVKIKSGQQWKADKLVAVSCYRDTRDPLSDAQDILEKDCRSYDDMLKATQKAWEDIWEDADIYIEGDEQWQGAIRYNIFQLIQTAPSGDEYASIGARGLMHGRYKGCYFWDTEIFMFPFFQNTDPETARNLLLYRYHTLKDAVKSAEGFSLKGARYSWMSSDTGFEQCETWDTGACEVHITADIAYAVDRYVKQSGDISFLVEYGAEMLVQTARYWTERFTYSVKEDRYHLLFVKGPDEYCGVTSDDFFTVKMAVNNLKSALEAVNILKSQYSDKWEKLRDGLKIEDRELDIWQDMIKKVFLIKEEKTGLWIQDQTFEYLEDLDVKAHKKDEIPLYHQISYDRLQRYKVLKQPAVLMYMALAPDEFNAEEIKAAWNYYVPKTLHDSTLSYGIHALIAARYGMKDEAAEFFNKSLFLDLKDVMGNIAREGIHTAALGATWQALVYGFAGLKIRDGRLVCQDDLPDQITAMKFNIYFDGKKHSISLRKGQDPVIIF